MRWPWKLTHFSYERHDVENISLRLVYIVIKTGTFQGEVTFDPAEDEGADSQGSMKDLEIF